MRVRKVNSDIHFRYPETADRRGPPADRPTNSRSRARVDVIPAASSPKRHGRGSSDHGHFVKPCYSNELFDVHTRAAAQAAVSAAEDLGADLPAHRRYVWAGGNPVSRPVCSEWTTHLLGGCERGSER